MHDTLLLLPGLLCDAVVWEHQARTLGRDFDVRVVDLCAFDSITAMARHVLAVAPPVFSLAGHSMGARVAMEVVRLAPERVARLALLDTGVHPVRPGEADRRQALIDLGERDGMRALADAWLPPMVQEDRLERDPELRLVLYAMVERMTPDIHRRHVDALLTRPDPAAVLSRLRVPLLVGVGRHDRWSPPEQHEPIANAVPGARYVVFEDAGHMAPLEAPEAVTAALATWMATPAPERGAVDMQTIADHDGPSEALRANAEWRIARRILEFAHHNDGNDHQALAAMFTADGSFSRPTDPDNPVVGQEAIRTFFRDRPRRVTRHVMSNIVVDVVDAGSAEVRSYVTLFTGERGEKVIVGDFHDQLVKAGDGAWLFQSRRGSLAFDY